MRPRAVLLDLFGTLIAYGDIETGTRVAWEGVYAVLIELGERAGRPMPTYEDFVAPWERNMAALATPDHDGATTPFLGKLLRFFRALSLPEDREAAACAAHACLSGWDAYLDLPEDTLPALAALKERHTLALVSNFDHPPYARALLDRLGLTPWFDALVISGELWVDKPDPRIFRRALADLGVEAGQAVHVGDDLRTDIAGAEGAGCRPILIDRRGRHPDYAGLRIESLADLPELLERL